MRSEYTEKPLIPLRGESGSTMHAVVPGRGVVYVCFFGTDEGGVYAGLWEGPVEAVDWRWYLGRLPITPRADMCCVSASDNTLDLFANTADAIRHVHWDGSVWSTWQSLGGGTNAPSCVLHSPNCLYLFTPASDNSGVWGRLHDGRDSLDGGGAALVSNP